VFSAEETAALRQGLEKRALFEKCWDYYAAKYGLSVL
jgi:hypothetical protein